jgi:hypothetical protein
MPKLTTENISLVGRTAAARLKHGLLMEPRLDNYHVQQSDGRYARQHP